MNVKLLFTALNRFLTYLYRTVVRAEYKFKFSYSVYNSLNDPYYYWNAENLMYLNKITFDYSGIKDKVGQISTNCIVANNNFIPKSDKKNGIYEINVNGLIWPGQGGLIVWRSK